MNSEQIFALGLGLQAPWKIQSVEFKSSGTEKELHIDIDFERGAKFPDETGALQEVHDTKPRTWRHLNFFQHVCYLHCRIPRIKTQSGKVHIVQLPWARACSGFTLLFEAYVMALIENEMPINKIGKLLSENPHRMWTIFNYWIERAYSKDKLSTPTKLGVDETSRRKGHDYITVAVHMDERRVFRVEEGKDKAAIKGIKDYLEYKGIDPQDVQHASMDMSPSFISGVREYFPKAEIHFDKFHVIKMLNEAMDVVRRLERIEHQELRGHKYTFLKKQSNLSDEKKNELAQLITLFPTLGKAYRLKELFNDLWDMPSKEYADAFLKDWCQQVEDDGIEPFKKFVKTLKIHWSGIVNFCETRINNGILEGVNNKIQLAKRRARGYRTTKNFINMIYYLCGRLEFDYPLYST